MKIKIDAISIEEIKSVLEQHNDSPKNVRIYLAGMGWSGPSFGLALDELKEGDLSEDSTGINFVAEKDLVDKFEGFTIEKVGQGFRIIPSGGAESACGSCGGSCG